MTPGNRTSGLYGQSIIAFTIRSLNLQRGRGGEGRVRASVMVLAFVASHFVSLPVISPNAKSPFLRLIRVPRWLRSRVRDTLVAQRAQGRVGGLVVFTKEALCGLGLCGCVLIPCAESALTSAALQY